MIRIKRFAQVLGLSLCCLPYNIVAQDRTSPIHLFEEGKQLFSAQNYAASESKLNAYLLLSTDLEVKQETEYMLACIAYEQQASNRVDKLLTYVETYPDTPHAERIYALVGAAKYYEGNYKEALAYFNAADLEKLSNEERDKMTYIKAICYMRIGNLKEAAAWLNVVMESNKKYEDDCLFHLSCIRYASNRKDDALDGFLTLQHSTPYRETASLYVADIYAGNALYLKAIEAAETYLKNYPKGEFTYEIHRIIGEVEYHRKHYTQAIEHFKVYTQSTKQTRRDILYKLGLSYYNTGVYSEVPRTLEYVTKGSDELAQNAWLHIGLAHLQLMEKDQARMAFEQAAHLAIHPRITEVASYNYIMCLHETSYSAFGESIRAFEQFLNDYPDSRYKDKVSNCLTDVYLSSKNYESALSSIQRITHPNKRILLAKQQILYRIGTELFVNSDFTKAIERFSSAIALGKLSTNVLANSYYWRGESYYRLNYQPEAGADFKKFLLLNKNEQLPIHAIAYYNLGYLSFHKKLYPQACDYFLHFLQTAQDTMKEMRGDACNRIADCYLNNRAFEEAKQYYAQAEREEGTAGDYAFYQLALVSGLQKDYTGKITLLNRLIGKYPTSPYIANALYEKGRAYVQLDNKQQAINTMQELVTHHANHPLSRKAAAEIGLLYYQNNQYNEAIEAYKLVVTKYPASEEAKLALTDLRSIFVDLNRIDEYAALASSMPGQIQLQASTQDSLTYIAAEKVYMRGKEEEATRSFTHYLQTYPNGAFGLQAHFNLCSIALKQKKYDMVLTHSAAILNYPNSSYAEETLSMRADAQFVLHQFAEAIQTYKLLAEKATTKGKRQVALTGRLRSAYLVKDDIETIQAADKLLNESKLAPELQQEARYYRAKAYINREAPERAQEDLKILAKDTRNLYGAEAKYLVANYLYTTKKYAEAEKELLNYIDQSTPHAYWLARSFILLADVYTATGKTLEASQYLLSLQQNYQANDNIADMIEIRLNKLNKK